uniref:Tyrosine specific protein phosphatases domain-containing protein n=1 Tax=Pongo abelii TaxID=9601 RepID=A0A8I5YUI4_PONAB
MNGGKSLLTHQEVPAERVTWTQRCRTEIIRAFYKSSDLDGVTLGALPFHWLRITELKNHGFLLEGLGRTPVLVALALIESGMKNEDAVQFIREKWRGAFNSKQLSYLEKYHSQMRLRFVSGIGGFLVSLTSRMKPRTLAVTVTVLKGGVCGVCSF